RTSAASVAERPPTSVPPTVIPTAISFAGGAGAGGAVVVGGGGSVVVVVPVVPPSAPATGVAAGRNAPASPPTAHENSPTTMAPRLTVAPGPAPNFTAPV